jgi:hypothetical protein
MVDAAVLVRVQVAPLLSHRGSQAIVELPSSVEFGFGGLVVLTHPPGDQFPPGQPVVGQGSVVNQAELSVLNDVRMFFTWWLRGDSNTCDLRVVHPNTPSFEP